VICAKEDWQRPDGRGFKSEGEVRKWRHHVGTTFSRSLPVKRRDNKITLESG
jgi:hypothetical protein